MEKIYYTCTDTPVGRMLLAGDGDALTRIGFQGGSGREEPKPGWYASDRPFVEAVRQLDAYFRGDLRAFDLPLAPAGTAFQKTVWLELLGIPYAGTASYGEIARRIGRPAAVRAVGAANGRNPLPIVVPCHRVIGSDGSLTGYGGGLAVKEFLLDLERRVVSRGPV